MSTNTSTKENPIHQVRSGVLGVSIWRREGEKGPFYSVTVSRAYRQGEEWKHADSFGQDDLLLLAKLIDQAHSWIIAQPAKQQAA
jgi:hypothetical protein